ncbi:Zn(II)2Cys6 transcription factor [Aspergillus stella-maris]|uniref:Zn(II)2Cys6 transcription factor n=1 Tax=Aspergillus stella-maris TaxID=1810926 RepID=UPI003CCDB2DE
MTDKQFFTKWIGKTIQMTNPKTNTASEWIIEKIYSNKNDRVLAEEYFEDELSRGQPSAAYGVFRCRKSTDPVDIAVFNLVVQIHCAGGEWTIRAERWTAILDDLKTLATGGSQYTLKIRRFQQGRLGYEDLVPGRFIHRVMVDHAPWIGLSDELFRSFSRRERDAIREAFKVAWIESPLIMSLPRGPRSHRKSKAGCLQCKKRKVKCDESKPGCRKCAIHGVSCSFTNSAHGRNQAHSPVSASSSSSNLALHTLDQAPSPHQTLSASSPLNIKDLELLHHFMTSTCYTTSRVPAIQSLWRDEVPRIAFSTPFLLHALLAVSALHIAHSNPSRRTECSAQAHLHHNAAVTSVIPEITSLVTDNAAALYLFSSLTCMFSCADMERNSNLLILSREGQLSQWIRLFRGIRAVLGDDKHEFQMGILAPIFVNGEFVSRVRQSPEALQEGRMYVLELKNMVTKTHSDDTPQQQVYQDAIDGVARALAVTLKPSMAETAGVFAWMVEASDEYLKLLRKEEPTALIVFSYICAAVRQVEWTWWTEGLSARLMGQVYAALKEEDREWLRWPAQQIGWQPTV